MQQRMVQPHRGTLPAVVASAKRPTPVPPVARHTRRIQEGLRWRARSSKRAVLPTIPRPRRRQVGPQWRALIFNVPTPPPTQRPRQRRAEDPQLLRLILLCLEASRRTLDLSHHQVRLERR